MSYYSILVMASSQLNTLSCRWDSCYGWGRYLRFLFDQLQTFRFWAMSQDLSWLEVFRWSSGDAKAWNRALLNADTRTLLDFQYFWYSIIRFPSWLQMINDQTFQFFFKSSVLFRVRRRPSQIGLPPNPSICSPLETRNNYHCFKSDIIHHFRLGVKLSKF